MAVIVQGKVWIYGTRAKKCTVCGDLTKGRIGDQAVCEVCARLADMEETKRAIALSDAYGHGARYGELP